MPARPSSSPKLNPAWPYPFWVAHRGAGHLAPENTLAAIRLGVEKGWRMFECDVKLSQDQIPFLLHDDDLQRTTNGQGHAALLPWAQLQHLDAGSWHSPLFRGENPPSLEQVSAYILANNIAVNLEIKPCPGREAQTGRIVAQQVARWASAALTPPLLSSFSIAALTAAQEAAPQIPRGLLVDADTLTQTPAWAGVAHQLDCVCVVLHHPLLSAQLIDDLHHQGLRVLSYTVNDADLATRLRHWGIDGLITDELQLPSELKGLTPTPD